MSVSDGQPDRIESPAVHDPNYLSRLAQLEWKLSALAAEVAMLREEARSANPGPLPDRGQLALRPDIVDALRSPPSAAISKRPSLSDRVHAGAAISGDELESLVGRYATLALAALVILMAVGAVIKMAVQRGLLTPEVRVEAGALSAIVMALAGMIFRRRGEVRFGNVLLALALAIVDLVAWGAGPRLHLVSTHVALGVVDVAAVALASLALSDGSEFLFVVATAGALSSPFVTSTGGGTALALLLYGGTVLTAALRAARNAAWRNAFAVLVAGALVYAVAASMLPESPEWYGVQVIALFGGACAAAALVVAVEEWKSELPRAYLAISAVGVATQLNGLGDRSPAVVLAGAVALAVVTYLALFTRPALSRYWTASALLLPLISLGLAYVATSSGDQAALAIATWAGFALIAWLVERRAKDWWRAGIHLFAAAVLGSFAVTAWLWATPLELVAGLAGWGICVALLCRFGESTFPLLGIMLPLGAAAASAIDQLSSRPDYAYTPFTTRSSASAFCAALGIGIAGQVIAGGNDKICRAADRPVRLGALIGFLIVWGRMEFAGAFNHDLASFLLTSYYAACGVGSIMAGRRLRIARLRAAGLTLALYAAVKAVVEVTNIGSIALRVGAYAAVGVFLLCAGYLYREKRPAAQPSGEALA